MILASRYLAVPVVFTIFSLCLLDCTFCCSVLTLFAFIVFNKFTSLLFYTVYFFLYFFLSLSFFFNLLSISFNLGYVFFSQACPDLLLYSIPTSVSSSNLSHNQLSHWLILMLRHALLRLKLPVICHF